ncbi:MAG: glycosyltransferase family 39 protein [Patescibacteria group bacterium]|nr:glycosyltransferase family 39 protein [bacterium]MDZ4240736.1 glycosyltransferase family 39 protein [Patescibacteria group bacterium]
MYFLKKYKIPLFIFLLALSARVVLFFINLSAYGGDFEGTIHGSDWYFEVAKNITNGIGFSLFPGRPSPIHVPLYPLFLSSSLFLFGNFVFAVIAQIIMGSCIPVLGRMLSLKLIPSEKIALFVGIALALEPNLMLFSSIFFSETLFIFLFLLFILSFISYLEKGSVKLLLLSVFFLGISALTKPAVQFFPIFLIPIMWWVSRKNVSFKKIISHSLLFLIIFLSMLSPWLYRNYKVFGTPGMTVIPSLNLYFTFVPSVLAVHNNTSFALEQKKLLESPGIHSEILTFKNASQFNKAAIEIINPYPKEIAQVVAINMFTFFTHDGMLTVLQNAGITPHMPLSKPAIMLLFSSPVEFVKTVYSYAFSPFILVLLMRLFWVAVTVSFFVGCARLLREKKITAPVAVSLIIILYFVVTTPSNGLTANARFRLPVVPILLTIAAYPFLREKEKQIFQSKNV